MNDPLESAIPVGSGPGKTVPPTEPPPATPPPTSVPPPANTPPPASMPRGSDKIWAILGHVSGFISVPIILPLIVYLAMKNESAYVGDNAKEALNFHLSLLIYAIGCGLLTVTLIGAPLAAFILICLGVGAIVFAIIAALRASEGGVYRYPLTVRLVK